MNAFVLIVILAAALYLFVSVVVFDMAALNFRNDNFPVEDTGLYVRYQVKKTVDESGIYAGDYTGAELKIAGNFGYDWGLAVEGDTLYCNEYSTTRMGFLTCDVVKIDLNTFDKVVLYENTMLKGRCASGELVCMGEIVGANWFPKTNPFYTLYSSSLEKMKAETDFAIVRIIDPENGETVWTYEDSDALAKGREDYYLSSDLSELMKQR